MRLPYRQRLSLILAELGTGLAGRGSELGQVIRRADPALKEVDKVLALLVVAEPRARRPRPRLRHGARAARPRAHARLLLHRALEQGRARRPPSAATTSSADIERLPTFLRELRPTMRRIGALSDEMTPVLSDLGDVAPDVNRVIRQLGPFSTAGIPALESLGEAGKVGIPAMRDALPVVKDLRRFGKVAQAGRQDRADGARVVQEGPRHPAPARLRLLPGGRRQRLRLLRPLPAGAPDPQHLLALLHEGRRRLLEQVRRERRRSRRPSARAPRRASDDPVLERTSAALAGKDPDSVAPAPTPLPGKAASEEQRRQPGFGGSTRRRARWGFPATRPTPATTGAADSRRTPPRLPLRQGQRMRGRGSSIAGNPVLIGAATVLVIIVAMFLSYNANAGLPFVPTYQLKVEAPSAAALVKGNEVRIGGARVGAVDTITTRRRKDGTSVARDRHEARARRRPAAQGLDDHHPPEVGARPQVRRDHARHLEARATRTATRSRCRRRSRPRSSSTSS